MDARLRAWWSQRQRLDGSAEGMSAREVLEQTGWVRSVAGASPYLALFARAGLRRAAVDAELPAARGCTYIVRASQYGLALKAGQDFSAKTKVAAGRRAAFEQFQSPKKPHYVLTGSLDNISHLRRATGSLIAPEDAGHELTGKSAVLDLPGHAILDRGRLVGLWHFDPETESIAWTSFVKRDSALEEAVKRTEAFVREDLGDARTFSLDSPKSRAPQLAALRKAAGKG